MADIRPDVQNRVQLRPVTDAKFQAQDFGKDQIGRGLQAFGQGLSKVADDVQAIDDMHNEAAVKKAENKSLVAEMEALRELEEAKGEDVLRAHENYNNRMENIRKEASGLLTNDRQKRMFSDVFDRRAIVNNDRAQRFATKATLDFNIAETSSLIKNHLTRSAEVFDESNPVEFDKTIITMVNERAKLSVLLGEDKETRKLKTEEIVGAAYVGVANRMKAEDGEKALAFVNKYADKIPPDMETELRASLKPDFIRTRSASDYARIKDLAKGLGLNSQVEDPATSPDVKPDLAKAETSRAVNASPVKDRKYTVVKGGEYGASRGDREHGGLDMAIAEGTPAYPYMRAKVISVDKVGKTNAGYNVRMINDDGNYVSYSHLRSVHVEPGDIVDTDTVVGSVGRTGKGGKPQFGAHLHVVVRKGGEKGPQIDPAGYKPGKPTGAAGAGEPGYKPQYDDNPVDIKALYSVIDKLAVEEDWTLARIEQAKEMVMSEARAADAMKNQEYDAVQESITSVMADIIKNGGDILDPDRQLPGFTDASPAFQLQIRNQAASNKAAIASAQAAAAERANKARIEGNYGSYLTLLDDAIRRPELFMMHDIDAERGNFPKKEWERLKKIHKELRANGGYRPALSPELSKANSLASSVFAQAGINPKNTSNPNSLDAQKKAYLTNAILEKIDELQQDKGRKLTGQEERDEVLKPLLRTVTVEREGRFWGTNTEDMPWYQANMDGSAVNAVVKIKN